MKYFYLGQLVPLLTTYQFTKMSSFQAITSEHINAANDIMDSFHHGRWTILIAQMQSGKTFTFLLLAYELLRIGLIDSVVIFSGNAELDLKSQIKDKVDGKDAEFHVAYIEYLMDIHQIRYREACSISANIKSKFEVFWGTELKKYDKTPSKTLFIWEEAHFAQSKKQNPDKFLKRLNISADGDVSCLEEHQNFVLTVSATPFSELSDNIHHSPNKKVVYLRPGQSYNSVKTIRDTKKLVPFNSLDDALNQALRTSRSRPMYALVRITKSNEAKVISIINANNWNYIVYDSLGSEETVKKGKEAWKNMKNAPEKDTVILLRGMCRMGKNLEKSHVLFVMETAKSANTDTILQGLLGRVCGYSQGSSQIDVYIHQKIVNSGEIDRYIELIDNLELTGKVNVLPNKAMNITGSKVFKTLHPIIPFVVENVDLSTLPRQKQIVEQVYDKIMRGEDVDCSKTQESQFQEICNKIQKFRDFGKSDELEIVVHNMNNHGKTLAEFKRKFAKSRKANSELPEYLHFTGVEKRGTQLKEGRIINFFCYKEDDNEAGIKAGSVVVYGVTETHNEYYNGQTKVPRTTENEVFFHTLQDGTEQVSNGGFTILLPLTSCNNVDVMGEYVVDFVEIAQRFPNARSINSQWDAKEKQHKGIILSKKVEKSLMPGGEIYEVVHSKGYTLALNKAEYVNEKEKIYEQKINRKGYRLYASISW